MICIRAEHEGGIKMKIEVDKKETYAIYGINRISKQFLYVFDDLNISKVYEDNPVCKEWDGFSVADIKTYKKGLERIIICCRNKTEKEKRLKSMGLAYEIDYLYEEDLFTLMDEKIEISHDKEIVVWGTGRKAEVMIERGRKLPISLFIDSYTQRKEFCGYRIVRPNDVQEWDKLFIVIAVAEDRDIKQFLIKKGLSEGREFISYRSLYSFSDMLRKTMFAEKVYDFSCDTPLNHLEVVRGGNTICCCSVFLSEELGSILQKGVLGVWNSAMHKILCLSTQNRTYTFCKKDMCPYFIEKKPRTVREDEDWEYHKMEPKPEVIAIGYDDTCNLRCETCRKELYIAGKQEEAVACAVGEKVKKELLPNSKFFILAGGGEVFASKAYAQVYESEESAEIPYIRILSNGTLFTPVNWNHFKAGKKGKIMVTFSIDAARKETYEEIRRGGNFDIIQKNMEFASKLRKCGELAYFRMNFVVQKKNYLEMPEFVKWGESLGVDEVFFTKILNWGTFTEEEFKDVSMMCEDGITPKPELEKILNDPMMRHRIVDLGTIRYSQEPIEGNAFHNYYMWELERKVPGLF